MAKKETIKEVKKAAPKTTKSSKIKSTEVWPKVVKGSHLTVTTFENGQTELVWDDEALAKEVREAIMQYELSQKKPAVRAKVTTRLKRVK